MSPTSYPTLAVIGVLPSSRASEFSALLLHALSRHSPLSCSYKSPEPSKGAISASSYCSDPPSFPQAGLFVLFIVRESLKRLLSRADFCILWILGSTFRCLSSGGPCGIDGRSGFLVNRSNLEAFVHSQHSSDLSSNITNAPPNNANYHITLSPRCGVSNPPPTRTKRSEIPGEADGNLAAQDVPTQSHSPHIL